MNVNLRVNQLVRILAILCCSQYFTAQAIEPSTIPVPANLQQLRFESSEVALRGADARWQLQLTGIDAQQRPIDLTRSATYRVEPPELATVDPTGFVTPQSVGEGRVVATIGETESHVKLNVSGIEALQPVNFKNQVIPIFTKFGCNGGGCHGKAAGQNGFKLSLLGFESREDYEHLVNESRGRRLFPAAPDQSLLLLKSINESPHGGGKRMEKDSHEYRVLARWISQGMPYGSDSDPVVTAIQVVPDVRTLARGAQQQLSVIATYSDGSREDITRTAQYESNNKELAEVTDRGLVTLNDQAGDGAVMARFQGQVAVFRASVPIGKQVDTWPETRNIVDTHVFEKLKTLGIPPSPVTNESNFIRRVTLDIAGRLPTTEETEAFFKDQRTDKYEALVDRLLDSTDYADYFASKWSTILRNRRNNPGEQFGSFAFHQWLRASLYDNKPYDQLVRELLTASGTIETNPAVAWYREVANTESRVEDAAQLFLGQRVQCARCHHHPFEKWSQADYYRLSAFFSKVTKKDGPTAEEPIFVSRLGGATAAHPKSGQQLKPAGLDASELELSTEVDPRQALAEWMVASDNPFFARMLVNRYWKHFFSRGLVEPEDDLRVTNPPSNPELFDGLAKHFVDSKFDLKGLVRLICTSTTYRLDSGANEENISDHTSYSRYYPKRLSAEVLLDAVDTVIATQTNFDGMPSGTRAVSLPDTSFSSYFLTVFGRPESTTACECERSQEATLAQSLHLLNSKEVQAKLASDAARPARLAADTAEDRAQHIRSLYMRALSRQPNDEELAVALGYITRKENNLREAYEDIVWALINSKEFLFNH